MNKSRNDMFGKFLKRNFEDKEVIDPPKSWKIVVRGASGRLLDAVGRLQEGLWRFQGGLERLQEVLERFRGGFRRSRSRPGRGGA